jgi:hypothetical protein
MNTINSKLNTFINKENLKIIIYILNKFIILITIYNTSNIS